MDSKRLASIKVPEDTQFDAVLKPSLLSEDCSNSLDLTINQFLSLFKFNDPEEKNRAKFASIFNPLKLMGSIVLLACIVPSIPFLIVIATTLAIIKYVVLKNRNL